MIEKMQFLSITGPKEDLDRIMKQYLSHFEIQLENALTELGNTTGLSAFEDGNPYDESLDLSRDILAAYGDHIDPKLMTKTITDSMDTDQAAKVVEGLRGRLHELMEKRKKIESDLEIVRDSEDKIKPFRGLNYDISKVLQFTTIKFRFGKMPKEYYTKFTDYVYDNIDSVMLKCEENQDYVWLAYFSPERSVDKVDAVYASMHFERFFVPDEYVGTPTEATASIDRHLSKLTEQLDAINSEITSYITEAAPEFIGAYKELVRYSRSFNVRKLAALTNHDGRQFYILCGWMKDSDANKLRAEIADDEKIFYTVEKDHEKLQSDPPVSLKNPALFKPFELYIRMYGLPSYGEMDPTILVAITYSILFGFMFGDAGQGAVLLIVGLLLYKFKHMALAGIIASCGFFSTIFGFLFGSLFGFEDIIEARWLHPQTAMTQLPMIGNLNTVFVYAVAIGMGLILMMMILNILNALKNHKLGDALFSTNGAAGFIFYGAVVLSIVLIMTGHPMPGGALLGIMFGVPLVLIFFKEPLEAILEKKKIELEGGPGMFVVQGFFEMFEVMLSYFSNTLSFVRVGAFAVSHAAMMQVVLMLAGVEAGNPNWIVVVVGNLFVMGMEGLIVGIQVLRLEYYELFSRFYTGAGREFVPYTEVNKK